ncbi:RusA family crossover junction endodeoxyribonuclease [Paraburkholderia sp. 22B1P]|uniref:RusA family crossover junction endodeoxyribonuclease n=1 Tax=Paraburkholderia sp. 22B1P TaxID=3080498 RepID=UPI00308C74F7|nr:RusA family crossover junction endodeoxyribonuclease [Paraburkholderia sp. 22B1P]
MCDIDELKQIEIEREGALAGLNPMFGEWRKDFNFEPVSYANGGPARTEFKQQVRSELGTQFVYTGHVSITIVLYLEEQKVLETPTYGDLDNYAKSLLDSIKGAGTPLIDDCQIQHLDISWIDVPHTPRFEVVLRGNQDEFSLTPLKLFEMPDGLYYPVSSRCWTTDGPKEINDQDLSQLLDVIAIQTGSKRRLRHELRQEGIPQFRAFQYGKYVSPVLSGFHRTRVVDSGFELIPLRQWKDS